MWTDICNYMDLRNVSQAVSLQREVERLEVERLEVERLEVERLEAALQGQTNLVNELAAVRFTWEIPAHYIIRVILLKLLLLMLFLLFLLCFYYICIVMHLSQSNSSYLQHTWQINISHSDCYHQIKQTTL